VIRYTPSNQLSIEQFGTPFQLSLDTNNRWVKLANKMPWDKLASIYHKTLSSDQGAPATDARVVIGAFIVKHKMKLDDRETIEYIRENMYVQYFLGLSNYTSRDVFDRSLFTTLRYRLGADKFDEMSANLIATACELPNTQNGNEESTDASQDKDQSDQSGNTLRSTAAGEVQQPMVRGKAKAPVEFGAKLGVSEFNGYARINTLGWGGKPLGRPSKQSQTPYQKSQARKENGERNHVEGKFGQGKNGYNLNKIRARRARTSESWIACIFFVMNLIKFNKDFFVSCWTRILYSYQMLGSIFKLNKHPEVTHRCNIVA
jgi:hypothetical protein